MELVLDGDVLERHSSRQGNYTLAEGLVEGFPYWNQQDGEHAIWKSPFVSRWLLGWKGMLGTTWAYMFVRMFSKVWPTQILGGYHYAKSQSWHHASSNDVQLKDCKYK